MSNRYVIIGGGPAATNAVETIRQFDQQGDVTLVCDEPAHSRMALPYWLSGQIGEQQTHTADDNHFRQLNVTAKIGLRVDNIDTDKQSLSLNNGESLTYDKLLIATGARPNRLNLPGDDLPGVHHLWTLDDTRQVLQIAEQHDDPRVVLIGAGFIGFIVLSAMYKRGWKLSVVEREKHLLPRMLDSQGARLVDSWLREKGIKIYGERTVKEIQAVGDEKKVLLSDGTSVTADIVVIAVGVTPNTDLVDGSDIQCDHGILVDQKLQTTVANVYAGGDVAQGPAMLHGDRRVHAIQPTAVDHGRVAGANMTGEKIDYPGSLSMNVLDVCGLQCASFALWDDESSEAIPTLNARDYVYRNLRFTGDRITGAVFVGRANDMGMLTDVGMVKGFIQTQTELGPWKQYLVDHPFDVRRAFIACRVADQLNRTTLIGRPAQDRAYRHGHPAPEHKASSAHAQFIPR